MRASCFYQCFVGSTLYLFSFSLGKEVKKKDPNHTKPENQLPLCVNNKIVEALNLLMTSSFKVGRCFLNGNNSKHNVLKSVARIYFLTQSVKPINDTNGA